MFFYPPYSSLSACSPPTPRSSCPVSGPAIAACYVAAASSTTRTRRAETDPLLFCLAADRLVHALRWNDHYGSQREWHKLKLTCFKRVWVGVSLPYESPSFSELGPGDVRFHLLELLDSQIWDNGFYFFFIVASFLWSLQNALNYFSELSYWSAKWYNS